MGQALSTHLARPVLQKPGGQHRRPHLVIFGLFESGAKGRSCGRPSTPDGGNPVRTPKQRAISWKLAISATSYPVRPGGGRDPYAVSSTMRVLLFRLVFGRRQEVRRRGVWVPACAGTRGVSRWCSALYDGQWHRPSQWAESPQPRFARLTARATSDALDLGAHHALHDVRQVFVEPALQHRTEQVLHHVLDGTRVAAQQRVVEGPER